MNAREIIDDLQGLDPNNPGAWPGYARIGAIVLIMAVIIGAGTWYLVKPKFAQLEKVESEETQLRQTFETKQKKIANLDAYKAQLEEMRRSFGAMLQQLPNRTEVENMLNDISQTRVASGLEEEMFQPQGQVTKEFYAELPNKITVVGSFHEMGSFVSGVAALPRIVTVDQVEIRPAGGNRRNSSAPDGELRMQALAKTFRYLDENDEEQE